MATSRIYKITPRAADGSKLAIRLVRAPNAAQALRFVAKDFNVEVASQNDLVAALGEGVKVEDDNTDDKDSSPTPAAG